MCRLVIPDRPGNKRLDRAWITCDPGLLDLCVAQGKRPVLAVGVEVDECFLHCRKAFLRSRAWAPETWPAPEVLPSMACALFDQIKPEGKTVGDYEREIDEVYESPTEQASGF